MKKILDEANIDTTNKSNHSLQATAISQMHENNVPENLIMERSGHLSREGLTYYEHTTVAQRKAVCNTLSSVAAPVPLPVPKLLIPSVPPRCVVQSLVPLLTVFLHWLYRALKLQ